MLIAILLITIASILLHFLVCAILKTTLMCGKNWYSFPLFFTPSDLYSNTNLTLFGTILVYLLCIIASPIFVIGGLLRRIIEK